MINNKDEAAIKTVIGKFANELEDLKGRIDNVVSEQEKVNASLQELVTARRSGAPVQFMKSDVVQKTITENLNSQLINSTVNIRVKDPVASIGKQSIERIDGLIAATGKLVKSYESIKPRRPLINLTIYDGKRFLWIGLGIASLFLLALIGSIVWTDKKIKSIQEHAFYWGDRAYKAAVMKDEDQPGDFYHTAALHFDDQPEKVRQYVDILEKEASRYQEIKKYLLSILAETDARDIRVLAWEIEKEEGWFLYRFFDEELERSLHVWPNGKAEETTDDIVKDLASARKYSKRRIWMTIRERSSYK